MEFPLVLSIYHFWKGFKPVLEYRHFRLPSGAPTAEAKFHFLLTQTSKHLTSRK